jgi:drug/metabolite transporter (DMT)-like permease
MSALSRTSAANTALLIALNPAFTVLLAPLVGESLSRRRVIGLVIALAGAAVVITRGSAEVVLQLRFNSGDLLALCAACIWAVFNLASHLVLARISPSFVNLVVFAGGGATLFLLAGGEEPVQQLLSASFAALSGLVIMSVISSVLAGHAFLSGVRKLGVSRAVLFIYLVPVLTAALSVLLLGERFQLSQAVGGFAVLIGVYWGTRGGLRPEA